MNYFTYFLAKKEREARTRHENLASLAHGMDVGTNFQPETNRVFPARHKLSSQNAQVYIRECYYMGRQAALGRGYLMSRGMGQGPHVIFLFG